MLFVVSGVKRKAQVKTSDASEPPKKCPALDGEAVPCVLPGTSHDRNGPPPAVPGTSQDGSAPPLSGQSTPQDGHAPLADMPVAGITVQQSTEELQYALLGPTWGAGKIVFLVCAQRGIRVFIPA